MNVESVAAGAGIAVGLLFALTRQGAEIDRAEKRIAMERAVSSERRDILERQARESQLANMRQITQSQISHHLASSGVPYGLYGPAGSGMSTYISSAASRIPVSSTSMNLGGL